MTAKVSTRIKYRLVLTTEEKNYGNGRTVQAKIEICYLGEDELQSPVWDGGYSAADAYADLIVSAQCDTEREPVRWYDWRLEFSRPYSVDIRRAESMATVLRLLTRKLAKLTERFGEPDSFEAYAARVADILGGYPRVQFGRRVDASRDHNGTGYQWGNALSLRYWLEDAAKGKGTS